MYFIREWWSSITTLLTGVLGVVSLAISLVQFWISPARWQRIHEWGNRMKTKYKVLLTAIGVILIISSIIITSVNLYNDQQNTILNLNNEIFGLTHTQPYFQPWHSWGNETIRGNNRGINSLI